MSTLIEILTHLPYYQRFSVAWSHRKPMDELIYQLQMNNMSVSDIRFYSIMSSILIVFPKHAQIAQR